MVGLGDNLLPDNNAARIVVTMQMLVLYTRDLP
jgi:hypothetical protein